jgi:hypothetical protein
MSGVDRGNTGVIESTCSTRRRGPGPRPTGPARGHRIGSAVDRNPLRNGWTSAPALGPPGAWTPSTTRTGQGPHSTKHTIVGETGGDVGPLRVGQSEGVSGSCWNRALCGRSWGKETKVNRIPAASSGARRSQPAAAHLPATRLSGTGTRRIINHDRGRGRCL